ncbi:MAG TPA: aminotransferase class III-fold pyridoxal phosphate-dependent enzyme [Anaerolineaceae bacterium]|nr:aminotransferase class III-fold pyridoxal phosphate-dependent enzyme [Anaerolineaceae bacterium]HPT23097.1 aminotransferase class III-fold pyridoxal phosphate-dependent enzyme [Anaerolineaceae bacterium]
MNQEEWLGLSLKHNFWTWSSQGSPDVIHVNRAEGVYFWDEMGKRFLDFNSMTMCVNIGHGNTRVQDAMIAQIRELTFAGPHMSTRARALLGQKLAEIMPDGIDHFLYTLGGADANENAVKLARDCTGKNKILTRYRSYHGATMGAMALTGDARRLHWEPSVMPGVVHFIDPYRYRSAFYRNMEGVTDVQFTQAYLDHLEEIIQCEGPQTIAGILLETVTGTNGIIIPPDGYLQGVRALCDKYKILVITDEVMCGFGRTGEMFAFEHWGIVPDIITMAKGITSGYAPLGAVAMRSEIAAYYKDRQFVGGLTYNGHPVSLAAALANINVIQEDHLVENAALRGEWLKQKLTALKAAHPCVGEVRSIGLFGAIELVKDRESRAPLTAFGKPLNATMKKVTAYLAENGIYIKNTGHMLLIIPPLIITDAQLEEGLAVIDAALQLADEDIALGQVE